MGAALVGARALFALLALHWGEHHSDGPAAEMSSIVLAKGVSVLVLITVVARQAATKHPASDANSAWPQGVFSRQLQGRMSAHCIA
jgi:hypothetical protein